MSNKKNKRQLLDKIAKKELRQGSFSSEPDEISNSPLVQMGRILLIRDNHSDFYQLARDCRVFEYNIECSVMVVDFEHLSCEHLHWIDIYTGLEHKQSDISDNTYRSTSQGFEGAHSPEPGTTIQTVPAEGNAPEMFFTIKSEYITCYPQTDRLFGITVKQCARAWAKLNGYDIPLENVIVYNSQMEDAFIQESLNDRAKMIRLLNNINSNIIDYNPDLGLRLGITTPDIYKRLADEVEKEIQRHIPVKSIAPLLPEQVESLEQMAGTEFTNDVQAFISRFNAGQTYTTSLHIKAAQGDTEAVISLLESNKNLYARDNNGLTPLHAAVQCGRTEIIQLLLRSGADINARTKPEVGSMCPLDYAIHYHYPEVVQILIEAGTDLNTPGADGQTSLMIACVEGKTDLISPLLKAGADIDAKDKDGWFPLLIATCNDNTEIVKILLDAGANFDAKNSNDITPLLFATYKDNLEIVKILLDAGAKIDAKDGEAARTPLMIAADNGNSEIVKILLDAGADIEAKNIYGATPLMIAMNGNNSEIVKILLDAGANNNTVDE